MDSLQWRRDVNTTIVTFNDLGKFEDVLLLTVLEVTTLLTRSLHWYYTRLEMSSDLIASSISYDGKQVTTCSIFCQAQRKIYSRELECKASLPFRVQLSLNEITLNLLILLKRLFELGVCKFAQQCRRFHKWVAILLSFEVKCPPPAFWLQYFMLRSECLICINVFLFRHFTFASLGIKWALTAKIRVLSVINYCHSAKIVTFYEEQTALDGIETTP